MYINLENAEEDIKNYIKNLVYNPEERKEITEKGYLCAQKFTDENV